MLSGVVCSSFLGGGHLFDEALILFEEGTQSSDSDLSLFGIQHGCFASGRIVDRQLVGVLVVLAVLFASHIRRRVVASEAFLHTLCPLLGGGPKIFEDCVVVKVVNRSDVDLFYDRTGFL